MQPADDFATSFELQHLVDRTLVSRQAGRRDETGLYARAAEGLVKAMLPDHSNAIAAVASRKAAGREIGLALAQRVSPSEAGAILTIWLLRGARKTATDALSEAFRHDAEFDQTVRLLCRRVFEPTTAVAPCPPMSATSIEAASPYGR